MYQFTNTPTPASPSTPWTTVSVNYTAGGVTLDVVNGGAPPFPSAAEFDVLVESEWLRVTAGAGTNSWTVVGAQYGSAAANHAAGASVFHVLTAAGLRGATIGGAADTQVLYDNAGVVDGDAYFTWQTQYTNVSWDYVSPNPGRSFNVGAVGGFLDGPSAAYISVGLLTPASVNQTTLAGGPGSALYTFAYIDQDAPIGGLGGFATLWSGDIVNVSSVSMDRVVGDHVRIAHQSSAAVAQYVGSQRIIVQPVSAGAVGSVLGYLAQHTNSGPAGITTASYLFAAGGNGAIGGGGGLGGLIVQRVSFYSDPQGGMATNAYPFWADEQGVFAIKADNTFNAVYQAIPALYNPQVTKYTAGAANYERIVQQWESNVAYLRTEAGGTGTLRALGLGGFGVLIPEAVGASGLTITGATQTASFPALTITQTWNNGAVVFTAVKVNVTNTASAAASKLLDLQLAGVSLYSLIPTGVSTFTGAGNNNALSIDLSQGSKAIFSGERNLEFMAGLGWGVTFVASGGYVFADQANLFVRIEAANTLSLVNSTNANTLRVYETFTNSTNFERGALIAGSNRVVLAWETAGTGADDGDVELRPAGAGLVLFPGGTLLKTLAALTNGAAAQTGTLLNAPAAGNPTKWFPIDDNGTVRYIPAW